LIRRLAAAGDRAGALGAYKRLQDRLRNELGIAPSAQTREVVESLRGDAVAPPADVAGPESAISAPAPPARERAVRPAGTVTLLFTDQVSTTEALQELGDDEAQRLRRAHFRVVRDLAAARGGQEAKNLGDGLMVAFASAVDAVAAAVGIQQAVHRLTEREGDARLGVRVGLNVGEPIVDEDDYFGTPVVVAKRLCDAAQSGQILASDLVRTLVGTRGGFEFRPLGALPLKGIGEPVASCEIGWAPTTEQRIPLPPTIEAVASTPLVGRGDELSELEAHWQAALGGEPRVVALAGEPGIGKTRLAAELCRAVHTQGAAVLAGRCYEEMLVPYQPFVEALRHYVAGCPPAELTVQVASRRRELAALVPELADGTGGPATRDPGGADQERFRLFEAVVSLIGEAAAARPLVLVLDDLHWADEATLLLLRHLVRSRGSAQLMLLVTYRATELDHASELPATLAELRRAHVLQELTLGGLPDDDVAALIGARSGDAASQSFARRVAERTDGNPFFIEELLRHVEEPTEAELQQLEVPATVRDLLLRRLERLDEACRRALATAAVAGHEFDLALVGRVTDTPDEELVELFESALARDVLAEDAAMPGRYRFAHPLIRETIYRDLSATRRALVHRRIGECLETLFADHVGEHAGTLAHHFHAGGDAAKAYRYHREAGAAAERVYASDTAREHLNGAIAAAELLGIQPEADADLRDLYRRRAWIRRFGADRIDADAVLADYQRSLDAARAADDRALEMLVLNELGIVFHIRESETSIRYHEESLALAVELGDDAGQVNALRRLSIAYAHEVDLERALELGSRALALAERGGGEVAVARALDALKLAALMLGDTDTLEEHTSRLALIQRKRQDIWFLQWTLFESAFSPIVRADFAEAARRLDEALGISRRIGDAGSGALILTTQCLLERSRGDYARALDVGEEAVRFAQDVAVGLWRGWAASAFAVPLADVYAWQEAVEALESGLAAADRINARAQVFACLGPLAWASHKAGDEDRAREAAERWDEIAEQVRVPPGQAYLYARWTYTGRARMALATGDRERAESILAAVVKPIERFEIRDGAADVYAALADCALARGEKGEAQRLLQRGLELVGGEGFAAERLRIHSALASLGPGEETARHAAVAIALIDEIAASMGAQVRSDRFRAGALDELESSAAARP
jgi:class 3 adenylate cyclase/tetratricopeptide (TPR) repeat protein